MNGDFDEQRLPEEFRAVADRLRDERATATGLELDRAKVRAMTAAKPASPRRGRARRARAASTLVAGVLVVAGAGAVGGGSGGLPGVSFTQSKSTSAEYCPQSSQQPGKKKNPAPDGCGKPQSK
jgi:hypothetical protein